MPIALEAETIAALHVPELSSKVTAKLRDGLASVQLAQTRHRLDILEQWGGHKIFDGASVLELGCGQGDMSTVLSAAVSQGAKGKVVAWDPAPGLYGSPLTLAEAQEVILGKPDVSSLDFRIDTPLDSVLGRSTFTHAVLVHSLYYFSSESTLLDTFRVLASHRPPITSLCLAEYALTVNETSQVPHLLAVLAQSASQALSPDSQSNVRSVISPRRIKELAQEAGWQLGTEAIFDPNPELQDGGWEAGTVAAWPEPQGDASASSLIAFRDATASVMRGLKEKGKEVQTMPVWCAVFRNSIE